MEDETLNEELGNTHHWKLIVGFLIGAALTFIIILTKNCNVLKRTAAKGTTADDFHNMNMAGRIYEEIVYRTSQLEVDPRTDNPDHLASAPTSQGGITLNVNSP